MVDALIGFAVLLGICFLGVPLAFATLIVGIAGFAMVRGVNASLVMAGQQILEIVINYGLSVIPLFILMGAFIHRANISDDLYDAGYAWLGRFRGGLAMSTVGACAGFSAVCGSSLATAATMSRVAMPPMRRYGYADSLSTGSLAAGGTLGIMIPPSVPMAIYGIVAEEDIGKLFIAGILPGAILVLLYMLTIRIQVWRRPESGPPGERTSWRRKIESLAKTWPVLALFVLVLGGIYLGIFTPTEAAGIGALGGFAFALARRPKRLHRVLIDCFAEAVKTSALIFSVAFGALVFANFVNIVGMPQALVSLVESLDLGPLAIILAIALICVLLGMVFESIGILVLVIPVFLPTLMAADIDLIWFGIIVIIVVEMGLITPPIGMNVFTVKSVVPDVPLTAIFRGVIPFVFADLVALLLILALPGLALWLPGLMR
ncbi:MAG: TRAP transporter large permease [Azospirillaceae bacterium]